MYLTVVVLLQAKHRADLYRLVTLATLQIALSSLLTNSVWLAFALLIFLAAAFLSMSTLLWTRLRVDAGNDADAVEQDTGYRAILRLVRPVLRLTATTAIVGGISFLLVPRVWSGNINLFNNELPPGSSAETGFSERVSLGEIGEVMESNDIVCEIRSEDLGTGETVRFDEQARKLGLSESLLRGAVLDTYENGGWIRARGTLMSASAFNGIRLAGQNPNVQIRHRIKLEPLGTRIVFTPGWLAAIRDAESTNRFNRVDFDAENQVFSRPDDADLTDEFTYLITTRKDWNRGPNPQNFVNYTAGFRGYQLLEKLQKISGEGGLALRADLRAILSQEVPDVEVGDPPLDVAEKVLHFLRDSGKFGYTLNLKTSNPNIDPVIDFLRNRREGHCEYFASAMALLMRSVGIPVRLVNGFKGGDYDETDGVFRIRQLHAHAWIEVYDYLSRGWYTYDPTPGAREVAVSERAEAASVGRSPLQYLQGMWSNGMFLSRQQQQRGIYGPLSRASADGWSFAMSTAENLGLGSRSERGAAPAIALLVILFLVAGAVVMAVAILTRRRKQRRGRTRSNQAELEQATTQFSAPWYDRYVQLVEDVLRRKRTPAQTQQEFSSTLQSETQDSTSIGDRLRNFAPKATAQFYRLRFGRHGLSDDELAELNHEVEAMSTLSKEQDSK